ncbi:hypothetical protein ACLI08_14530 [Flavobacterium sp. RNTU_13]|uniref:hypothetical protein n=1 Tax=Flavobacterium sp. RNTU_13 TaxID=3375145 RepID=UPI0039874259
MKTKLLIIVAACMASCVQKTEKQTVVFEVAVPGTDGKATNVALRGTDFPLNWQEDKVMVYDSVKKVYRAVVTYNTGYKFTEYKYVVNGVFEMQDKPNRKVKFNDKNYTVLHDTAQF